jgi:hypothetical protein
MEPMAEKTSRWTRRRIAGVIVLVAALGVLLVVTLVKCTPEVYRRTEPLAAHTAAGEDFDTHVVNQVGNVLLDKSGQTRLDLEITEEMVNARISRFLADMQRDGKPVPQALEDARIGFEGGEVVFATRLGSGPASVIVAQRFRLAAEPDGRLRVEPAGTSAGLMPLPGGVLERVRQVIAAELARQQASGAANSSVELWRHILEGFEGKSVALGKGKSQILVESVAVEQGVIRVKGRRAQ